MNLCYILNMQELKKLPVGIQSFERIINNNFIYIDKTDLIYDIVHSSGVFFLSRPRRFGKSLLVSTLKSYFEGSKDLFKGLAIEKLEEKNHNDWKQFPVFNFNFTGVDYSQENALNDILDRELKQIEEIYGRDKNDVSESDRFYSAIKRAHEKTGKGVVILVDEYDKPLLDTMDNPSLQAKNRNIFKGFWGVLKATDQWTRFAFFTGVTKFAKVSIFSDLNQLRDISMVPKYESLCGITQKEIESIFTPYIKNLAKDTNMTEKEVFAKLKVMYDGYHFCEESCKSEYGIYNPFSILNAFADSKFQSYWINSGTSKFLVDILEETEYDLRDIFQGVEMDESTLTQYRTDSNNPIPVIYQSGYLTIKDFDKNIGLYTLGFPNEEVKNGFLSLIIPYYTGIKETEKGFYIGKFYKDLQSGNVQSFMERLQSVYSNLPTHRNKEHDVERDYQVVFLILFEFLGQFINIEQQTSTGRCDAVVSTEKYVYIFEFKLNRDNGKTDSANEALAQINNKDYALSYKASKKKLIKISVQFNNMTGALEKWIVE